MIKYLFKNKKMQMEKKIKKIQMMNKILNNINYMDVK